jgi:hypothetical protein
MEQYPMQHLLLALAIALGAASAHAHDTWFEPQPGSNPVEFLIGSGNRFPLYEGGVGGDAFAKSGCRGADGKTVALTFRRHLRKATLLRADASDAAPLTCWAQLQPFDVELTPELVQTYFKEIRPSADVIAAWDKQRAQGVPFRERYVKSARHDGAGVVDPQPTGIAFDVLRIAPAGAPKVGAEASFQLLRDGRPIVDFPVEFVNEASPLGLWQRTDAQGRVTMKLPLPGRWLLRGTELRPPPDAQTPWLSWFVAYSFEAQR